MFETFRNAWKTEDLRKRLLYTLLILILFRLGCAIPVPYITSSALESMFTTGSMLTYLNMMSGGAMSRCTIFALGVQPYINATIIIQLLCVAIPYLENLSKEGEEGRQKLTKISNYTGAAIALLLSIAYYFIIRRMGALKYTDGFAGIFSGIVIVACFTAGAQFVTWMGNQIDAKGIGNGLSLMIFAGIVADWSRVGSSFQDMLTRAQAGASGYYIMIPAMVILALVAVVFVVILTNAERRIPVQYAKRVVGRKMYGGQASYIPIKVNMSGVMPIIFASTLCGLPNMIGSLDISNQLRKNNGTIPGIRPGKPTSDFITKTLSKITLIGAVFLAIVAAVPMIIGDLTGVSIQLGGTSLLIIVGVALDTARSLEGYMTARHHKGFLE